MTALDDRLAVRTSPLPAETLLRLSRAGLLEASQARAAVDRYAAAHLAALVDLRDNETPYSALPLTAAGVPDARRGMRVTAVVYVRAADALPASTVPRDYFRNRILASNQSSSLGDQLRADGYKIDDGAADAFSNMDKLLLRRVDGFTIAVSRTDAADAAIAGRQGANLVRLPIPLRTSTVWLSASTAYHQQHGEQVEAVWNWWSENSARRLAELMRVYGKAAP